MMALSNEERAKIVEEERVRAEARANFQAKPKKKLDAKGCGCLVIILAILAVMVLIALGDASDKAERATPSISPVAETTPPVQDSPQPAAQNQGLNVTRAAVIDVMSKPELGFSFEAGTPSAGRENYTAQSGQTIIQLLGPAENLNEIGVLSLFGSDETGNVTTLIHIVGVANVVEPDAVAWITEELQKIAKAPNDKFEATRNFNSRSFVLSYGSGALRTLILTITPAS